MTPEIARSRLVLPAPLGPMIDLVLNRVNSPSHLGKTLAVEERHLPAVFESNMMRFAVSAGVIPTYLQFYLSSVDGKKRLTANAKWAVNQASINQQDVCACAVPLPPKSEQVRITLEVERLLSAARAVMESSLKNSSRSRSLRRSILTWAFEGKLVDQDPADEHAERLLARIRAERTTITTTKKSKASKERLAG